MKRLLNYFLLLIPSALFFTTLWTVLVVGGLYHSTDSVPILDFKPPFVMPEFGEYYNVSEPMVWVIWFLFIGFIFFIPYYILKKRRTRLTLKIFLAFLISISLFFFTLIFIYPKK